VFGVNETFHDLVQSCRKVKMSRTSLYRLFGDNYTALRLLRYRLRL